MADWPLRGPVLLSEREEHARADRITTDVTLRQDLEASARERGLRYCDECSMWFPGACFCVTTPRDE
jgi:hypothetical protein